MAKDTFASDTFKAHTWASGHWVGVGVDADDFFAPADTIHYKQSGLQTSDQRMRGTHEVDVLTDSASSQSDELTEQQRRSTSASPTE